MLPQLYDNVRETTKTTGTGAITLLGAVAPNRSYSGAGVANGDSVLYTILHRTANEREVGIGTWNTGGSITRTSSGVISGSSGAGTLVNLSSGTKDVFLSPPAAYLQYVQNATNVLINGDGTFFQRQAPGTATARSDDTYAGDRFYVLTQTASINVERSSDIFPNSPFAHKLTQNQASAQRMGYAQIVEHRWSKPLRGKAITFQGRMKCSSSQAIRFAILEWTGTADSVTSDVVNSWTNSTYTAGQFFLGSNLTVAAVGSITPSAATDTAFSLSASVTTSCNNLIVLVWTEGTAAQNVTLELGEMDCHLGAIARQWSPRTLAEEEALCGWFYETNFPPDTAPANGTTTSSARFEGIAYDATVCAALGSFKYKKRVNPTNALFSPNAGTPINGRWSWLNPSGISWVAGTSSAMNSDREQFYVDVGSSGAFAPAGSYVVYGYYTSDAEL